MTTTAASIGPRPRARLLLDQLRLERAPDRLAALDELAAELAAELGEVAVVVRVAGQDLVALERRRRARPGRSGTSRATTRAGAPASASASVPSMSARALPSAGPRKTTATFFPSSRPSMSAGMPARRAPRSPRPRRFAASSAARAASSSCWRCSLSLRRFCSSRSSLASVTLPGDRHAEQDARPRARRRQRPAKPRGSGGRTSRSA